MVMGSIPGLGRSPGEGKGYPVQYSGLEKSMDCIKKKRIGVNISFSHCHLREEKWCCGKSRLCYIWENRP